MHRARASYHAKQPLSLVRGLWKQDLQALHIFEGRLERRKSTFVDDGIATCKDNVCSHDIAHPRVVVVAPVAEWLSFAQRTARQAETLCREASGVPPWDETIASLWWG